MVTGDHPRTAEALARRAGIVPAGVDAAILTGDDLDSLRKTELARRLDQGIHVFARTTPEQKWKIVAALHDLDRVVAMTGDGVNDAPALRAADVGIAMGKSGTDVAREAAQVILLDDNFASIVQGIEEGRAIFTNIRKFTDYVLASNGPEIVPYLAYMVLPIPLALTIIQILSIDLGTDVVPAIGLGQEKPDPEAMAQPPRDRRQRLLNWPLILHSYLFLGVIEAGFAMFLFFWVLIEGGWSYGMALPAQDALYRSATGITLSSIILMQVGNLIGRRSLLGSGIDRALFVNPLIMAGIAVEIAFSWAILYFPPLAGVLGTGPVDPAVYAAAWFGPFLIWGLDYGRKRIVRTWRAKGAAPAFVMER
jgi:sodium/potassium-transporting ATPase subunit alpha